MKKFTLRCALSVAFALCFVPVNAQDLITLTETTETGAGIITRYSYNNTTGLMDAINYAVNLNTTSFGTGTNIEQFDFDILGKTVQINANYDTSLDRISSDQNGQDIVGDFIVNYGVSDDNPALGGAIYNEYIIGNIKGDFVNNKPRTDGPVFGGAIYNSGSINNISGDFISNIANGYFYGTGGGAIYNKGNINDITGDFIGNYGTGTGGGGAIHNQGVIRNLVGNFINNHIGSSGGGGICNTGTINNITANFINNIAYSGGAIFNSGNITNNIIGNFINNHGGANGGAICNTGTIGKIDSEGKFVGGIINSSFIGNFAYAGDDSSIGGAIYSESNLNIIADNGISEFTGNYIENNGEKDYQAIYLDFQDNGARYLTLSAVNNGIILMNDKIAGIANDDNYTAYTLNIDGDSTGTVYLNNDVTAEKVSADADNAVDIQLSNVTLHLANRDNVIDNNKLTLNSGTFNMINNSAGISALNTFTVKGATDMYVDVDLANKEMDRIEADAHGTHTGTLNVAGINLLTDAKDDFTAVYFAQPELKNNVTSSLGEVADINSQKTFYSPIYKYTVTYDKENQYDGKGDGGYFLFSRGGGGSNSSDAYNPSVLSAPVATQAAGHSAMNESFRYVFQHADAFTQLPAMERFTKINSNRYAAASTDFNQNIEWDTELHNQGVWVRPYTTFEKIDLKNGPNVDAVTYGTLVGYDSDFRHLKNGWTNVGTGYLGYMGSQLNYSGVDTSMNGGLIGLTETFYKGNFWTALTATAGAGVAESQTMYGKEDSTMLLAGLGSKTGYNFEFKEGKFILQPIMFLSYTFVNTFDYTNAAGVRIKNDPMHTIQINPSVRFITNLKNGWQPYASVGMVWNLLNESTATANNVELPTMSTKPYVEYGVGLQRRWDDKFTAFGQAMMRQGGRTGIALTAGFRWALGVEDKKAIEKPKVKKVLKETKTRLTSK